MKICKNCGTSNGDDAKFCVSCGSNVSEVRKSPQQTNYQHSTPPQTSVGFGDKSTGEHLVMLAHTVAMKDNKIFQKIQVDWIVNGE